MKNDYLCPHCKGHLNVNEYVAFSAKGSKEQRGLIFLSPEVGDYSSSTHPCFKLEHGTHIEFFCPICSADLAAPDVSNNLARVLMVDEDGLQAHLLFSEIYGEKCTYRINKDQIEAIGDDASHYMNFFGESPV